MPVHPVLAAMLAAWKRSHWARIYGRAPALDDLIVPIRTGSHIHVSDTGHPLTEDLALGLRSRPARAANEGGTISAAGSSRPARSTVPTATPRTHGRGTDVLDGYIRATWAALCAEVGKLRVSRPDGEVLPVATAERKASNCWRKGG